jgi:hypothetical protein
LFWLANKIAKKLLVIPLSSNVQRKI